MLFLLGAWPEATFVSPERFAWYSWLPDTTRGAGCLVVRVQGVGQKSAAHAED